MTIDQNRDVVHRFIDEWLNGQNRQSFEELTTEDYVLHFPGRPEPLDRSGAAGLAADFHQAFPDFFIGIENMVAEGDWVAAIITLTGTNRGPYMGMQPTGKAVRVISEVFYRLQNGRIVEDRPVMDQLSLLQQLGIAAAVAAEPVPVGGRL